MHQSPAVFIPFLIGGNKVFLTRPDRVGPYAERLSSPWRKEAVGDNSPFRLETKDWLGRTVHVAGRTEWVDLNPMAAAQQHLGRLNWGLRFSLLFRGR
jgi:hypothetical protein